MRWGIEGLRIHDLFVTVIPGTGQFASLLKEWAKDCAEPAKIARLLADRLQLTPA